MTYCHDIRKAVLQIPKNGSQSMRKAMNSLGDCIAGGHRPLYDLQQYIAKKGYNPNSVRYATQIRNPVDRLISAINAYLRNVPTLTLDRLLKDFSPDKDIMFIRQIDMVEDEEEVNLFRFGTRDIYDWMGYEGQVPRVNVGEYQYTFEDLAGRTDFKNALGCYSYDFQLWELVKGT